MSKYVINSTMRPSGYQVMNHAGDHQFMADEPVIAKGTDAGPNPVQYLIAALNSCLAISARAVANNRHIDLRNLKVSSTGETVSLGKGRSKVDHIDTTVSFDCDLSAEEKQKLFDRILQVCTVHESLEGGIEMNVHIA